MIYLSEGLILLGSNKKYYPIFKNGMKVLNSFTVLR